jgi:hypothetical protein
LPGEQAPGKSQFQELLAAEHSIRPAVEFRESLVISAVWSDPKGPSGDALRALLCRWSI